jgi:hypothetical protein
MNLAETTFAEPPPRFRQHFVILGTLAILATALSLLIWWVVPNEGDGPLLGHLLDGLRDALLVILWGAFVIFSAASTGLLAVLPARWHNAMRLLLAYLAGMAAVIIVAWLIAR